MKICFKCNTAKPLGDFYAHRLMADGHLNKCKECTKTDTRQRYHENWEESRRRARRRRIAEESREIDRATRREYRRRPEVRAKNRARDTVERAIARGLLVPRPCKQCGSTEEIEAHHRDYSKPLDVEWVCRACHLREHGRRYDPIAVKARHMELGSPTVGEQRRNQRNDRVVVAFGKAKCMSQWAAELGIHLSSLAERLDRGWDPERAVSTPPRPGNYRRVTP